MYINVMYLIYYMLKLGTNYGGWSIPKNIKLNKDSIVYSGGVGEDISFDIKLQSKYNSNIFLIDPTIKAVNHFDECKKYFNDKNYKFKGNIQKDYYFQISNENPNINKFTYINLGLWNEKSSLKFYKQSNVNYVSQSLIDGMFTNNYDIVNVDSIKNIMNKYNHKKIDLLKLDIEGAENIVLEQMLNDNIYPNYLCVEFDLLRNRKDFDNSTKNIINKLMLKGYKLLLNDQLNITFELQNLNIY